MTRSPQESPASNDSVLRTRAFIERIIVVSIVLGFVMRLRILGGSPVPQPLPLLWVVVGLIQGLPVTLVLSAVLLASTGGPLSGAIARKAEGAYLLFRATLFFVWSEVIIFFGHPPRQLDLDVGLSPGFYIESARGKLGGELATLLILTVAAILWASRSSRRATRAWVTASKLLAGSVVSAAFLYIPWTNFSETTRGPVVGLARLVRERVRFQRRGPGPVAPLAAPAQVRDIGFTAIDVTRPGDSYPLAWQWRKPPSPATPAGVRPNIVFLLLEGVQAETVGAFGGLPPGLTPNLDRLAGAGIRFDGAYSPGTHTAEGELACWYGLLAMPREYLMLDHPRTALTGFPEILRARGWRDFSWMFGGDQTFYGRETFYGLRGFRYFEAGDFLKSDVRTSWGYSDRTLFRRAIGVLDVLRQPFAAMFLTISNHHPYTVPSDSPPPFETASIAALSHGHYTARMLQTVHYTDAALGEFFDRARREPWFKNTVFVICGDHGLPVEPLGMKDPSPHMFEEWLHRIPLLIYSPMLPGGRVVPGPSSQVDMLPTVLDLFAPEAPRAGLGTDLLAAGAPGASRTVILWSASTRTVSIVESDRVYHGVVNANSLAAGKATFDRESWIDPVSDPKGIRDLTTIEPQRAARARVVARHYIEDYPILVESGRSGLPGGAPGQPFPAASLRR
jgi:hypothetical protein